MSRRCRKVGIEQLRAMAIDWSLHPRGSLWDCVDALGFVQYDPLRCPARAQDLIMRQRVPDYRIGDLERHYAALGLEEDFLYVYGVMPRAVVHLLHPRPDRRRNDRPYVPKGLVAEVLAIVREQGATHPRDLGAYLDRSTVVNNWGGQSKASTLALEELHHFGLVRVARRDNGVRVYEAAPQLPPPLSRAERRRRLTAIVTRILMPVPEPTLRATLGRLNRATGGLFRRDTPIERMLKTGELRSGTVDGLRYLWCADAPEPPDGAGDGQVRFLAPFDPLVWDRRRFEIFWGWRYRFEAYTPVGKRIYGYYALPVLYGQQVIGWVNCRLKRGRLVVEPGLVSPPHDEARYRAGFEAEVARLEAMVSGQGTD